MQMKTAIFSGSCLVSSVAFYQVVGSPFAVVSASQIADLARLLLIKCHVEGMARLNANIQPPLRQSCVLSAF